jgi:isoleucyl-tRNA synthetase
MAQFYISVIFIGIILVIISFVWILYDRKKVYDYSKNVENKKAALLGVMKDAEEMVEELNNISGYILESLDSKAVEVKDTLLSVDEKIKEIKSIAIEKSENIKAIAENKSSGKAREVVGIQAIQLKNYTEEFNTLKNSKPKFKGAAATNGIYREVIKLSESGLGETEIAKKLKIGKGEIQLILGMNDESKSAISIKV